jgi:hypothetical protein
MSEAHELVVDVPTSLSPRLPGRLVDRPGTQWATLRAIAGEPEFPNDGSEFSEPTDLGN